MNLTYNISRSDAADMLDVSTRTVDRYINKWKLSYKKVSNRVYLSKKEIQNYKSNEGKVQKNTSSEVISSNWYSNETWNSSNDTDSQTISKLEDVLSDNIQSFIELVQQKDKTIEDKNQTISHLQRQIWSMKTKLDSMIALPEHKETKEKLLLKKERLELEKNQLYEQYQKERLKNAIYLILFIVFGLGVVFLAIYGL